MIRLQDISYVRLGTADLNGATKFATDYLGLEIAHRSKDSVYLKSDLREHTLCYFAGSPADQTAAFEVAERADLEAAACELDRLGHHVRLGSAKEAELRQVRGFIAFNDPTGNSIELVWRPAYGSRRYHGERDAGITGFSHIGLCTTDAARDEAFWTNVCNARVSDRIGDAALLRIDEVHHTIALFPANRAGDPAHQPSGRYRRRRDALVQFPVRTPGDHGVRSRTASDILGTISLFRGAGRNGLRILFGRARDCRRAALSGASVSV